MFLTWVKPVFCSHCRQESLLNLWSQLTIFVSSADNVLLSYVFAQAGYYKHCVSEQCSTAFLSCFIRTDSTAYVPQCTPERGKWV